MLIHHLKLVTLSGLFEPSTLLYTRWKWEQFLDSVNFETIQTMELLDRCMKWKILNC